jgi:transposase-like protein
METDNNQDELIDDLPTRQSKAIAALLTARDVKSAAETAGVSESTLHRWLDQDQAFRAALKAAEKQAIDTAVRRLAGTANTALSVVLSIMADKTVSATVRLRAALGVLEHLVKLREWADLEERITVLEEQLTNMHN